MKPGTAFMQVFGLAVISSVATWMGALILFGIASTILEILLASMIAGIMIGVLSFSVTDLAKALSEEDAPEM